MPGLRAPVVLLIEFAVEVEIEVKVVVEVMVIVAPSSSP
jgi:hypothetical protein